MSDPVVRFHLTEGSLESVPQDLCAMEARAHVACQSNLDVVLRSEAHTDPSATIAELTVLQGLGLGTPLDQVWMLDVDGNLRNLARNLTLQNTNRLRGVEVQPFTNVAHTDAMRRYTDIYGFRIKGSTEDEARRVNNKGEFLERAHHPDCNIPRGWSLHRDEVQGKLGALERLAPDQKFRLKPTFGASGQSHQQDLRSPDDLLPVDPAFDHWVLQEEVPKSFDASVQFAVVAGKLYGELVVTGQHVEDDKHHVGNYSLNGNTPSWVIEEAQARVRYLLETHYSFLRYGVGSVDIVVWLGGYGIRRQVYLIEMNWRWTAPRYALQAIERLKPRLGWSDYHWDMKRFRVPKGEMLERIWKHCEPVHHEPTLFIPFCYLPKFQFCYGLTVAPTRPHLTEALTFIRARQAELALDV